MRTVVAACVCATALCCPVGADSADVPMRWQVVYEHVDSTIGDAVGLDVQTESKRPYTVTRQRDDTPLWSPRGRFVLFRRSVGASGLYVLDTATRRARRLTRAYPSAFAWSRNGERIAYALDCGRTCKAFYVTARSGGRPRFLRRITRPEKERLLTIPGLTWAPRGDALAFVSEVSPNYDCPCPGRLHVMDLRRGTVRTIAESEGQFATPAWSPDGTLIAYGMRCAAKPPGPSGDDLWCVLAVTTPEGTGKRVIVSGGRPAVLSGIVDLAWRPGTHEIAFSGRDHIGVANARTGKARRFKGRTALHLAVSADGRRLGYLSAPKGRVEVHVANISDGRVLHRRALASALNASASPGIDLRLP